MIEESETEKVMLTIAGIGPGKKEGMTEEVLQSLETCDCIVGYTVYTELVRGLFPDKEYYATAMTKEAERCLWAIGQARAGRDVVIVCSGDGGVYGMAGLVCELLVEDVPTENAEIDCAKDHGSAGGVTEKGRQIGGVELRILPGVTAALSGAAVLGAPLANDFAVISLSDRLTPWEQIERRLRAAAEADFAICLYNPASKGRPEHLRRACGVLLESGLEADRICGVARNIGREGQEHQIMTLGALRDWEADMFTTVYIGSSVTRKIEDYMVTPRGYRGWT